MSDYFYSVGIINELSLLELETWKLRLESEFLKEFSGVEMLIQKYG